MTTAAIGLAPGLAERRAVELSGPLGALERWLRARDYAGYEPYDLLNSPLLNSWARRQPFATLFIQSGKHIGGLTLRRLLQVPPSRNPKAIGLVLSAYCELSRCGADLESEADHVRQLLFGLRSKGWDEFCWGYDWHYVSLRGATLPAFSANSVATVFCAEALLDHAETFRDSTSRAAAFSAADWLAHRLQRSVETKTSICLSYTPHDRTQIFNNSALIGAFLARVDRIHPLAPYQDISPRLLRLLADHQSADGSWPYGLGRTQGWIDHFHTGYNLCALLAFRQHTGDCSLDRTLERGYDFYRNHLFTDDGVPRYFHNRTYPIDVHACSQAILTFCAFRTLDASALTRAQQVADWTLTHLRNPGGSFGYQVHRTRVDRTPYLRWSQAWMFRALAALHRCNHERFSPLHLD